MKIQHMHLSMPVVRKLLLHLKAFCPYTAIPSPTGSIIVSCEKENQLMESDKVLSERSFA